MSYLLGKIFICLLLAGVIGLTIGFILGLLFQKNKKVLILQKDDNIRKRGATKKEIIKLQAKLYSAQTEINATKELIEESKYATTKEINILKAKLYSAQSEAKLIKEELNILTTPQSNE